MATLMGEDISKIDLPPDFSDLPPDIQRGLLVYEDLPNTYTGGSISTFSGKDLSSFQLVCAFNYITTADEMRTAFKVVKYLERKDIKESRDKAKAELDKASNKR